MQSNTNTTPHHHPYVSPLQQQYILEKFALAQLISLQRTEMIAFEALKLMQAEGEEELSDDWDQLKLLMKDIQQIENSQQAIKESTIIHPLQYYHQKLAEHKSILQSSQLQLQTLTAQQIQLQNKLIQQQNQLLPLLQFKQSMLCQANKLKSQVNALQLQLDQSLAFQDNLHAAVNQLQIQRSNANNLLQQMRGNVRVYCRVRPGQKQVIKCNGNAIQVPISRDRCIGKESTLVQFQFQQVFTQGDTQQDIFNELQQLILGCTEGKNICIFAYGQTGSGKTHTMQGNPHSPGIIPRSIDLIFDKMRVKHNWTLGVCMRQIYCDKVIGLIDKQDAGQTYRLVKSRQEAYALFMGCTLNRKVSATSLNDKSSRSHLIFTMQIHSQDGQAGYLNLIDLAGSQRIKQSKVQGQRLRESQFINTSLSQLGKVINALKLKQKQKDIYVPYRNCKLTEILQKYLQSQSSRVLMFVNISPDQKDAQQTVGALRFAIGMTECKGM